MAAMLTRVGTPPCDELVKRTSWDGKDDVAEKDVKLNDAHSRQSDYRILWKSDGEKTGI